MKLGKYNYNNVSKNKNICQILSLNTDVETNNKPNEGILEKIYMKLYMSIFINHSYPCKNTHNHSQNI